MEKVTRERSVWSLQVRAPEKASKMAGEKLTRVGAEPVQQGLFDEYLLIQTPPRGRPGWFLEAPQGGECGKEKMTNNSQPIISGKRNVTYDHRVYDNSTRHKTVQEGHNRASWIRCFRTLLSPPSIPQSSTPLIVGLMVSICHGIYGERYPR